MMKIEWFSFKDAFPSHGANVLICKRSADKKTSVVLIRWTGWWQHEDLSVPYQWAYVPQWSEPVEKF
jgi:hypothetical protein